MIGYINGQEVEQTSASAKSIGANDRPSIIGVAPWDLTYWRVKGGIDEVVIVKEALEAEDVKAIYESGWDALLQE